MSKVLTPIELRPARPGEQAAMASVLAAAWSAGYRGILDDSVIDATSEREWQSILERPTPPGARSVVACDAAGRIVGFTRFGPELGAIGGGYIASVYVHPDASGRGVGRWLVDEAVASLTAAGHPTVTLWVFRDNVRARSLYERCGFAADGAEQTDPRWGAPQVRYRHPAPARHA